MIPFFAAWWLASMPAAEHRFTVLLPIDTDLFGRIRGQINDLDWTMSVAEGAEVEGEDPMARARRIGGETGAAAVLWFSPITASGVTVHLADLSHDRLLARRIDARGAKTDRSALIETAALIVRSTLGALAEGAEVDWPEVQAEAPRQTEPAGISSEAEPKPWPKPEREASERQAAERKAAERPEVEPPRAESVETQAARGEMLRVHVGWAALWAGDGSRPLHGPSGRAALRFSPFEIGVYLATTFPATFEDPRTTIDVTRTAAMLAVGMTILEAGGLAIDVGLGGGLFAFHRATFARTPDVLPTPSAYTLSPGLLGELRATWFPAFASGEVGLEVDVGADAALRVPVFEYASGDTKMERNRIASLAPRVGVGLVLAL